MEFRNDFLEIDFAFPDRNFMSEFVSVNRIYAVFHMQIADIFPEYVERIERIAFSVKNDICGVKVDSEIRQGEVFDRAQKRDRCLLTGFKPESESELPAVFRDFSERVKHLHVKMRFRRFRDKAAVGDNCRSADPGCEIRSRLEIRDASFPCVFGNDAHGVRAVDQIPDHGSGVTCPKGGKAYAA